MGFKMEKEDVIYKLEDLEDDLRDISVWIAEVEEKYKGILKDHPELHDKKTNSASWVKLWLVVGLALVLIKIIIALRGKWVFG